MKKIAFLVASAVISCMGFLYTTGENIVAKFSNNTDLSISQDNGNTSSQTLILEKNTSDPNLLAWHSSHSSHGSHGSHGSHVSHSSHSSHYSSF